jgi:hypothetical protein
MTTSPLSPEAEIEEEPLIINDVPFDLRPMLDEIGITEVERGICEDTYQNRLILRNAKLGWSPVISSNGVPSGLLQVHSKDTAMMVRMSSLAHRKPILVDPKNLNSDYLTGLDLLAEKEADYLCPPWVLGATKMWRREQDTPIQTDKRQPTALPHRCNSIKSDGIRCMMWSSGRPKDGGFCRVHLRHNAHRPGDDIERARKKLTQAAPYAVDMLETLMTEAVSEQVRLKASTEILDRAGVRGGIEIDATVTDMSRPAKDIIAERLDKLATTALHQAQSQLAAGTKELEDELEDAEIIPPEGAQELQEENPE